MKNTICLIILLVFSSLITTNRAYSQVKGVGLVQQYTENWLMKNGYSFDVVYLKKDLFSDDTTKTETKVTFFKKYNKVKFLRLQNMVTQNELLLLNDSSWDVNPVLKSMTYLGGRQQAKFHGLFAYFPMGYLFIDTSFFNYEPSWSTTKLNDSIYKIAIKMINVPTDITDLNVEIILDSVNLLQRKITENAVFGDKGNLYQERNLLNYQTITSDAGLMPDYYYKFKREFQKLPSSDTIREPVVKYLNSLILKGLDGKKVMLPKNGMVFLDLWYVGCFPCMKATPIIEEIYHLYKDQVHFYSVNEVDDNLAKIKRFKEKMGVTMPVLLSSKKKEISSTIGNGGYPLFILMEAGTGKVLWSFNGYSDNLEQIVKTGLEPYVKKIQP
jgi:thiol-disulfide isomerase/thioredoxin